MKYNHCPCVAPLGVLTQADGWQKIKLDQATIEKNKASLLAHPDFIERMRTENEEKPEFPPAIDSESALYDGFLDNKDRRTCLAVRRASRADLTHFDPEFDDERLPDLLLHYKARNFEDVLTESEHQKWEKYRLGRINSRKDAYIKAIQELAAKGENLALLQDLQDWYQSLLPY